MPEDVSLSSDGTYILVQSTGAPSLKEMEQTLSKIKGLIEENQVNRVLVDSRSRRQQPPLFEIYSGAEMLVKMLGGRIHIALLVNQVEEDHAFFETVAINRGADIAYFREKETALHWLLADEN